MTDLVHQPASKLGGKVEFWKSTKDKQWRWRLKSSNGRIIATAAEGYIQKMSAIKGFESVRKFVQLAIASIKE